MLNALTKYPPIVFNGEREKRIKNLGWLLRHWRDVSHFTIRTEIGGQKLDGTLLIAWLKSGADAYYSSGWAGDLDHVTGWLNRPVFRGIKAYLNPPHTINAANSLACEADIGSCEKIITL